MQLTRIKFKCVGLKKTGMVSERLKNQFIIGNEYSQKFQKQEGLINLRLIGKNGLPFWVDASQFDKIKQLSPSSIKSHP